MTAVFKLVLIGLFLYAMINGFYKTYRMLNDKITGSRTLLGVVGFALLLIFVNLLLFLAGMFVFLKVYEFLSLPAS
ncbi:MAG TPA: hypothetical protein VGE06_01045 [Flavisolibacter sp.]